MRRAGANRPLAGITVLDFGQVYQGPYATLLMAKAGADVIKIEPPQGEPLRRRAPGISGRSALVAWGQLAGAAAWVSTPFDFDAAGGTA
jgi:crotonobetainyl-CoA:carnitine CoA-transferase CaiB-like acyl-CoA transferase